MKDENIRHYFLGKLSDADNNRLEEEIALDEKLSEDAQIVEGELVDDYLRDNLSAPDRKSFEQIYLQSEARREKVRNFQALWCVANEAQAQKTAVTENAPPVWSFWTAWRVAFVGFAAVLLLGSFIFLGLKGDDKQEMGEQQNSNEPPILIAENRSTPPIEKASSDDPGTNNSNLQQHEKPGPATSPGEHQTPSPIKETLPTLASFMLFPGTLRGEGEQSLKIPPQIQRISLRLSPPKDAPKYQTYSATLKTADGETVLTAANLKSLRFTLSAEKLENRTYIIFLEGQNAERTLQPVAEYTFRPRR